MAIPVWSVGQVLSASDVNNWLAPTGAAYKTAPLVRSTNSLSIDPDLQLTLAASSVYEVHCAINYSVAAGGFQVGWTTPASVTGALSAAFVLGGTGAGTFGYTWVTTFQGGNQTSPNGGFVIMGMLTTAGSGGTFGLNWANGTGANSTTIGGGSMLSAQRIG